jgi:putative ABC transport system permease protein
MLRSYFRTAYRHLARYKLYSLINVLGLAIGFSAFMLIMVYVTHELSYDRFHEDAEYIYKVNLEFGETDEEMEPVSTTPNALLPEFKRQFPEVIEGTRYFNPAGQTRGDGHRARLAF